MNTYITKAEVKSEDASFTVLFPPGTEYFEGLVKLYGILGLGWHPSLKDHYSQKPTSIEFIPIDLVEVSSG